jgi:arylsulfatase A-like enzyme
MNRCLMLMLLVGPSWAHAAAPPNVVLVMADDMGWAQTGYYGHPLLKTPNLDEMAHYGLRMDRFYAGAPSCTPTRASVMTGRTNDRTGAFAVGDSINKQEQMLSTAFQKAGYTTAHFGKWHLNTVDLPGDDPLPRTDPHNPGELGFDYWLSATNQFHLDPVLSRNGEPEQFTGDSSEVLVDEALQLIARETVKGKPVFVVIWYSSPHRPFHALAEDAEPFAALDPGSRDHHAEIVAMDRSVGAFRRGLRELNIADNTLVWFTSDNGGLPNIDYGPQHPGIRPDTTGHLRGFKKDFYEGGLRVPTIIEWPHGIRPRTTSFPASTMDIFPTLIEVANLDPADINAVHDGISIAHVFQQEPARRDQPIGFRASGGVAWIDNDYKLVRNYSEKEDAAYELYNLIGDPDEQQDLIAHYPEIAARLASQLAAWNRSVDRSITGADYPEGRVLPSGRARSRKVP